VYIASAYPNSALSALTMMVIGLVMAGSLAAWLGLVFLADRQPRKGTDGLSRESKGAVPSGLTSEERSDERGGKTAREGARR
jgi:hypothetical protein